MAAQGAGATTTVHEPDPEVADRTYLEPITPEVVAKILEKEHVDAVLPTLGGQTALNVAVRLAEDGTLRERLVRMARAYVEATLREPDLARFIMALIHNPPRSAPATAKPAQRLQ